MISTSTPRVAGTELGYAEITANGTSTANIFAETDIAGLSVTVTVGLRPIMVRFFGPQCFNTTAGEMCAIYIKESTTALVSTAHISSAASQQQAITLERRLAPSAGSHTYKVMASRLAAGTATIGAASTYPAFIQVIEL